MAGDDTFPSGPRAPSLEDLSESELRRGPRQQLPVVALLLPVHQDVEVLRTLLAVGRKFLLANKVEAHDRGRTDDTDRGILVFKRRPFVVRFGDARHERRLVVDRAAGVAVAEFF